MASRYEVEVTIKSARDLKNVNWRYGRLKPYAVVWVDARNKSSSRVDDEGDTNPYWDQTLVIPFNSPIEDSTLYIDIVHVKADEDIKPLIGSARLRLRDVVDGVGLRERESRNLELKRPSGRPHGKVEVTVAVREPRYRAPDPYYAPPYGVPQTSRDYPGPPAYAPPYGVSQTSRDYPGPPTYAPPYQEAPPAGYPYSAPQPYGQPAYGQASYGQPAPPVYRQESSGQPLQQGKKSKFGGMGTGLAVGAVAGVLGGLALGEGFEYMEDKIADKAAERVEDDAGYDDVDDF